MRQLALIVAMVILASCFLFQSNGKPTTSEISNGTICYTAEERTVQGGSLSGLINPNQTVKVFFGYYDCNEVRRGDIVAYNYFGNSNPIIKVVKGMPSDKFHLQKSGNGWNILINDAIVVNSQNEPYVLNENGYKMLSLYENDYKSIIPANAFLLLGNLAFGSLDSTHFGLVDKSDILGKVDRKPY